MNWDDDPRSVEEIDLLDDSELDPDAGERTTAIPQIPIDLLVRATMAEADEREKAETVSAAQPDPAGSMRRGAQAPAPPPHGLEHPGIARSVGVDPRNHEFLSDPLPTQPAPARLIAGRLPRASESALEGLPQGPPLLLNSLADPPSEMPNRLDRQPSAPPTDRFPEMDNTRSLLKDRYATGDFSGALELAEGILQRDAGDLEAQRFASSCRDVLTQMLASRIGSFEQIVVVALPPEELRWLTLDHRAGFFLSLVDGTLSIEELLDISGMARLESLRILVALLDQRVLRLAR